jgi:hypothetical protein
MDSTNSHISVMHHLQTSLTVSVSFFRDLVAEGSGFYFSFVSDHEMFFHAPLVVDLMPWYPMFIHIAVAQSLG